MDLDWDRIRSVLLTNVVAIADGLQVVWKDQPRPMVDPVKRAIILLSTIATGSTGYDERIQLQDMAQPQGQEIGDQYNSIRKFTLSIRCESYEQSNSRIAYQYLENIRTRFNFRGINQSLNAARMAWYEAAQTQDLSDTRDTRVCSIAVLDIKFRAHINEVDPQRFGYVDSVDFTGTTTS